MSIVRQPEEVRTVVIGNLSAFTQYSVTVTAFTGDVTDAHRDGMASKPILVQTLEGGEREIVLHMWISWLIYTHNIIL